jgi:hypothetical protein
MKGFDSKWCQCIKEFINRGCRLIINNDIGHYFQTRKGLWQGHTLSPILFKIVADMLAILINRAKEDGQVSGIIPHLVEGGLSILYITHIAANKGEKTKGKNKYLSD